MSKYALLNLENGVIEEPSKEVTTAIEKDKRVYIYNQVQRESYLKYLKQEKEKTENELNFNMAIKENCGSFCFNIYENLRDKEYLFRFAYLCSISSYDNYIIWGSGKDKRIVKKDLMEILNLSRAEYYRTIKYLLDNKMIIEDEKGFVKMNETFYNRGAVEVKESLKGSTRIFDDAIQELYEKAEPKEHKKLDLLIKLLPYVNVNLNVICKNTEEKNSKLIELYSLTELCEMFGFSTTQRFKRGLFDITVKDEKVIMIAEIDGVDMICINPKVYYKGNDIDRLRFLIDLFDIANNLPNKKKRVHRYYTPEENEILKHKVIKLREQGLTQRAISKELDINLNKVKAFLK